MTIQKTCKVCDRLGIGWGGLTLGDTTGICKDCMTLIHSLEKQGGWDKRSGEIQVAQAVNLAQNHALHVSEKSDKAEDILKKINTLYPRYITLLIQAKNHD